jgi:RimJ/RimL family protein N-acetyltransferase
MIHVGHLGHAALIAERAELIFNPAADKVISRSKDNELLGGVVYQGYTGASIKMHVAGIPGYWLSKNMLWLCFDYPFNQLGCKKVFAQIPFTNTKSVDFARRLGFKYEVIVKDVFPDGDLLVLSLYRENCRWLKIQPTSGVAPDGR